MSLFTLASTSAQARPANGEFGERSQQTIEIKVSVAPRFVANASSDPSNRGIDIASLAPGLRYHVVPKDPALAGKDRRDTLYMIVPD